MPHDSPQITPAKAIKLANSYSGNSTKDGAALIRSYPTEPMEKVALDIHILLRLHETSIVERHTSWIAGHSTCADNPKLQELCEKLSGYAKSSSGLLPTRTAALKAICALTVEDPYARKMLKECEKTRSRLQELGKKSSKSEVRKWALIALDAVENEKVHAFWSNVITEPVRKEELQQLKDRALGNGGELAGPPSSDYWNSTDIYIKIATKLAKDGPSEQAVESIGRHIRLLLRHDETSIAERYKGASDATYASADTRSTLQELCIKLLKYAQHHYTAIGAMEAIVTLAIEDPYVRKTLKECEKTDPRLSKMKECTEPEICEWASKALEAVSNEVIHDLWSRVIVGVVSRRDMQQLLDGSVPSNSALAELAKSLSDMNSSYLASRYLERADSEKQVKGTNAARGTLASQISSRPHPQGELLRKPETSGDLPISVLRSALEASLKDVSDVWKHDTNEIGKGGFSKVYMAKIHLKGKCINVAAKHLQFIDSEEIVIKNFARELPVLARLNHPNVSTFLGYMSLEDEYYIVSEYTERGTLRESLDKSKSAMPVSEMFAMSLGIAKGVCYLHDNQIVHANLKVDNIIVSRSGEPLLADLGMSESFWSEGFYTADTSRHSTRWLPHEYFHYDPSKKFRFNTKTDVWAFGMTLLELLTGNDPYAHIQNDGAVARAIANGVLPDKPKCDDPEAHLEDDMWPLCLRCWTIVPVKSLENLSPQERLEKLSMQERPSMQDILRELIMMKYRRGIEL